jgi:hypothetical protein
MLIALFAELYGYYFDYELMAASAGYVRNAFVLCCFGEHSEFEHLEKILCDAISTEPIEDSDEVEAVSEEKTSKYKKYYIIKCKNFCDVCDFCDILFPSSAGFHFIAKASAPDYPDGGFLRLMRRCYLKNRFQTATAFELLSLCSMSIPTGQISWQDSDLPQPL